MIRTEDICKNGYLSGQTSIRAYGYLDVWVSRRRMGIWTYGYLDV